MDKHRFLFDEDVSRILARTLRSHEPDMDILCVGEPDAPSKHTLDSELLDVAEATGRLLVSNDKKSMPRHLIDHFAKGSHTWGVVLARQGFPLLRYVEDVTLIWETTEKIDWLDRTDYIPY